VSNPPDFKDSILKGDKANQYIYSGNSMHPVFKPGQMLYVRPLLDEPSVGDVIVFFDPRQKIHVVHRVIKVENGQIYTRGDNNPTEDQDPVNPQDIIGVVVKADQAGTITKIWGGKAGYRQSKFQGFAKRLVITLKKLGYPIYKVIKSSGIIPKIWHPEIQKVQLKTPAGEVIKYVYHGKTVAQWDSVSKRFTYKHPYDLVIHPPETSKH
jgi:signal peptidase I